MTESKKTVKATKDVVFTVPGRNGVYTLGTKEEFKRLIGYLRFLTAVEEDFEKELGRKYDLGCSIDLCLKILNVNAPVKTLLAKEVEGGKIGYNYEGIVPQGEATSELTKEVAEGAEYVVVIAQTEEGKVLGSNRNFNKVLEETEAEADKLWNVMKA